MFFSIQFLFLLFYFILKLYYLVDKFLIFSSNGTKLEKYISNTNLLGITNNLENSKIKSILLEFYSVVKSPKRRKSFIIKILVSLLLTTIYVALIYNTIFSNFIYINFINKCIYLNDIFDSGLIYFQIFYIFLILFFISNIVNFILNKVIKFSKSNITANNSNFDKTDLILSNVKIPLLGLFQNILITGSIGSGKTSSGITNILDYLLKNRFYGLIIDVKGNYVETVKKVAKTNDMINELVVINLETNMVYNPLDRPDISASELSARMIKALHLISPNSKNSDSYWLDKVETYIKDFIVLIRNYNEYVNFTEIHKLTIDKNYLNQKLKFIQDKILNGNFNDKKLFEITNAINEIKLEYLKLDERNLNIIKSEITRITSPFMSDFKVNSLFCSKQEKINFRNKILVLSLNVGENKNLAKIISTYLKLDFQSEVLSKNGNMPLFFICDEYQEYANREDANFFSLSREYKCINIISMQSYSSLINTLNDEYASRVIIQNLVNKIWFRNDDTYTISEIIKQIGKERKEYKTVSISENSKESKYNLLLNKFRNIKSNLNESYSLSQREDYVLTEEYFSRNLNTFEAALLISDGNKVEFIKKIKLKRWEEV